MSEGAKAALIVAGVVVVAYLYLNNQASSAATVLPGGVTVTSTGQVLSSSPGSPVVSPPATSSPSLGSRVITLDKNIIRGTGSVIKSAATTFYNADKSVIGHVGNAISSGYHAIANFL